MFAIGSTLYTHRPIARPVQFCLSCLGSGDRGSVLTAYAGQLDFRVTSALTMIRTGGTRVESRSLIVVRRSYVGEDAHQGYKGRRYNSKRQCRHGSKRDMCVSPSMTAFHDECTRRGAVDEDNVLNFVVRRTIRVIHLTGFTSDLYAWQ